MPRFDAASISITSSELPGRNFAAGVAFVARLGRGALFAVERLGEDARGGRLAHAAHAGKNVGVGHAARANGVLQRARDVLLADDVRERLRPPFSRDDLVAHWAGIRLGGAPASGGRPCNRKAISFPWKFGGTSGHPRHTLLIRYRCSLPGLAEFAGKCCAEPEVPRSKILQPRHASLAQRSNPRKQRGRAMMPLLALRRGART